MRLMWLSRLTRMHGQFRPRRDLFDMGRLAGAVIALDHHAAVEAKPARIASVVSVANGWPQNTRRNLQIFAHWIFARRFSYMDEIKYCEPCSG
jgi:hypothetical protein